MKPTLLRPWLRSVAFALLCCTGLAASANPLRDALLLHASFDNGLDADRAAGEKTLYHTPSGNRTKDVLPGLPTDGQVLHAKGEGRHGDALRFTKKGKPVVFFKGEKNLGFVTNNWNGAASFWMRLDPDKDLEPGYCDPLQFVAQAWGEGNMFVEFSKDHTPRHFRYALMAITKLWNPTNAKWEEMPARPMIAVEKPPFTRERWTHVVFCFGNANTGKKDGWGKLYLDGKYQGEFRGWENSFNWDVSKSALTIGLNYVGWFDDLAVFNRPLTDAEVKTIYEAKDGVQGLVK